MDIESICWIAILQQHRSCEILPPGSRRFRCDATVLADSFLGLSGSLGGWFSASGRRSCDLDRQIVLIVVERVTGYSDGWTSRRSGLLTVGFHRCKAGRLSEC